MPASADDIKALLRERLEAVHVEVTDDSDGCGAKFTVLVVSDKFVGKSRLQRHRLVHTALAEELKSIHAFSQQAKTSEEWESSK